MQEYTKQITIWMLSTFWGALQDCAEKQARDLRKVFDEVKLLNKN